MGTLPLGLRIKMRGSIFLGPLVLLLLVLLFDLGSLVDLIVDLIADVTSADMV